MNKKIIIIPIIIIIGIFGIILLNSSERNDDVTFHITLADPQLYENGIYTENFEIKNGEYYFRFVPNGSSPEILSISITGKDFGFEEDFHLRKTLHQTGISEYYTWEYDGISSFKISQPGEVMISINPNGNVMGSVSVDILQNLEA